LKNKPKKILQHQPMKYFIFSAVSFISISTNAQKAALRISLHDSSLFVSELNGITYNDASTEMNFHELNAGKQQLKVTKLMRLGNSEVRKPVFEGIIDLADNRTTQAVIDQMNQFRITNVLPIEQRSKDNSERTHFWVPDTRRIETNQQPVTNAQGMNNKQFTGMIENLKEIANENERLQSAIGLASVSTISCNQLAEMMLVFEDEDKRIRLADHGQKYVTDPQNFGVVYNALRYPSSMRRLNRRTN
jgi:hypothetical protein